MYFVHENDAPAYLPGCSSDVLAKRASEEVVHLTTALSAENARLRAERDAALQAGAKAMREAAAQTCVLSGQDLAEGDWGPEGRDMAVMLERRIRALPLPDQPKETSHAAGAAMGTLLRETVLPILRRSAEDLFRCVSIRNVPDSVSPADWRDIAEDMEAVLAVEAFVGRPDDEYGRTLNPILDARMWEAHR